MSNRESSLDGATDDSRRVMELPRLLVIDDLFGRMVAERRNLCKVYRLIDVTDCRIPPTEGADRSLAYAVFCSGQRVGQGRVENSVEEALGIVESGWPGKDGRRWALCLLDLRFVSGEILDDGMPSGNSGDDDFGLKILRVLREKFPELPVIVMSSRERAEVIEACRRLGASDFLQRHDTNGNDAPDAVLFRKLREFGLLEDERGVIAGRSLAILGALGAARRGATGTGNILLLGETGTGKELFARFIHDSSPRAGGPYRVFHAFGTAETLQEDLLFGHERGAFTGARNERKGLFEEANGGTLFLDEVGDIPHSLQNQLLRPIESRVVTRQGGSADIPISLQLVIATNKTIEDDARKGSFKIDLFNRINAYTIVLPPLRDRQEDVPLIAEHMLERLCRDNRARWPRIIDDDARRLLEARQWTDGNVRELRNVLERAVKNNKDAEILVASDLIGQVATRTVVNPGAGSAKPATIVESMGVPPGESPAPCMSYEDLFGIWPELQRTAMVRLLSHLVLALQVTERRDARDGSATVNLAGAVGCLFGRKVTTIEAADFVKRLARFDGKVFGEVAKTNLLLRQALDRASEARKRQSMTLNDSDAGVHKL